MSTVYIKQILWAMRPGVKSSDEVEAGIRKIGHRAHLQQIYLHGANAISVFDQSPPCHSYRDGEMFLELAVIHFAGEPQHPRLVASHPHVDHRAGVPGRRPVVFGEDFQQELLVAGVVAERLFEHHRRGTVGVHHQRELGLRFRGGY